MPRSVKATSPFSVPLRFEYAYRRSIVKLLQENLVPVAANAASIDDWLSSLASMSKDLSFRRKASQTALSLVRDIDIHNVFGWKEEARRTPGGAKILPYFHRPRGESFNIIVAKQLSESTRYINSIPTEVAKKLTKQAEYARAQGATEQGVLNILRRSYVPALIQRIKLVSQTEPHKVNSALIQARSEDLGISCFKWNTSKDSSVRHSHKRMEGVVVFWEDLPSPEALIGQPPTLGYYGPGDCPNCRCNPIPIFSLDQLFKGKQSRVWVYHLGKISSVTRSQFELMVA